MNFDVVLDSISKSVDFYSGVVARKLREEKEDIRQELLIQTWRASKQYEKRRGAIKTFFVRVLKNQAKNLIKRAYSQKRFVRTHSVSMFITDPKTGLTLGDIFPDTKPNSIDRVEMNSFWKEVFKKISNKMARQTLGFLLTSDMSLREIGRKLGVSGEHIRRGMMPIIAKAVFGVKFEK